MNTRLRWAQNVAAVGTQRKLPRVSGKDLEGLTLIYRGFLVIQEVKKRLRKFSISQEYRISKYKIVKLTSAIPKMASNLQ